MKIDHLFLKFQMSQSFDWNRLCHIIYHLSVRQCVEDGDNGDGVSEGAGADGGGDHAGKLSQN